MKEWLFSKWKWFASLFAGLAVVLTAFLLGRQRKNGELNLAVAEHELEKTSKAANAAQAKVIELSAQQREIAKEILVEKAKRAGVNEKWESMDAASVRRRLVELGIIRK